MGKFAKEGLDDTLCSLQYTRTKTKRPTFNP
jgi:hypothetical protein